MNFQYIAEGEEDSSKLDVLLTSELEIIFFIWKKFSSRGEFLCLRLGLCVWQLKVNNSNIISFEYVIDTEQLTSSYGELDKKGIIIFELVKAFSELFFFKK